MAQILIFFHPSMIKYYFQKIKRNIFSSLLFLIIFHPILGFLISIWLGFWYDLIVAFVLIFKICVCVFYKVCFSVIFWVFTYIQLPIKAILVDPIAIMVFS